MSTTSEPPLTGTNYVEDKAIIDFCNANKDDTRCSCVLIPDDVFIANSNVLEPYFCWYEPCLDKSNFITYIISKEQEMCNSSECKIELKDLKYNSGIIQIVNQCGKSSIDNYASTDVFSKTYLDEIPQLFLDYYIYIVFISLVLLLILF